MKMQNKKEELVWDLSPLLKSEEESAINKNRKIIEKKHDDFRKKWKENKKYLSNPKTLKEALDDFEELNRFYAGGAGEYFYFYLKSYQDQSNEKVKSKFNKVNDFSNKLQDKIRFFALSISKISEKEQKKFLHDSSLKSYEHLL